MVKRKVLSVSDKVEIIKELESGQKNSVVSKKYGLSSSTVSTLWKNRETFLRAFENNITTSKRLKKCEKPDLDEALIKWCMTQKNAGLPINGPILKNQAEKFAVELGYADFFCSNGWIDRFKNRHNICYSKINGQTISVDMELMSDWLEQVWPHNRHEYADDDIYNAEEAGLFFNLTPEQTLKFKGEKCIDGKSLKNRMTVLICANMSGSDKRRLLVIGKSEKYLGDVKQLFVDYISNEKAWMTAEIFTNYVEKWDTELREKNRRIILLISSCLAHPDIPNLTNIKLVFLPPNSTSVLQPMDQGVLRIFRCHFRKQLILLLIERMEKKIEIEVSVLDAMKLMIDAWDHVTSECIRNCFRKAKLQNVSEFEDYDDDEDNLPLSEWLQRKKIGAFRDIIDINDFATVDEDVITSGVPEFENIITKTEVSDIAEDEVSFNTYEETETPTLETALECAERLQYFFETSSSNNNEALNALTIIKRILREQEQKRYKSN